MRTEHKIIIGDSRNMSSVKSNSIQLVVTYPPYWQLKDYGSDKQIGFNQPYPDYIRGLNSVWAECYRVLKKGGILLAGFDNGINYIFDDEETTITYKLPFNPLKDRKQYEQSIKNDWGIQFSHTIEEQIGGQLQAGFVLTDIYQDTNGRGRLHEFNVPSFYATRSIKK
jgi:SAM-dependent methyltransferase